MSDEQKGNVKVSFDVEIWPLALVIWWVAWVGDPDLIDALVHYLMKA